jgi:hypothetical protein
MHAQTHDLTKGLPTMQICISRCKPLLLVLGFAFGIGPSSAQSAEITFTSEAQATQYVTELSSFQRGGVKIRAPLVNLAAALKSEYGNLRAANNSSETEEEISRKYQVNAVSFDSIKVEFDTAIEFVDQIGAESEFQDIRELAAFYRASLLRSRQRLDQLKRALRNHELGVFDNVYAGLRRDASDMRAFWNTQAGGFQANVLRAKSGYNAKPGAQIGCPHPYGTKAYFLECLAIGDLSTSGGD